MVHPQPISVDSIQTPGKDRAGALRNLLQSEELSFLMEAHDGVSAVIARGAGFRALWASSLTISSVLGYRDASETSWSNVADIVERMADASGLPILVDGDTGHGNFNNARLFARKLQRIGAAGLCLEDKLFPKTNSLVGHRHPLADEHEFCGRLRAVREATGDFVLVARTEALIAGQGMDAALSRASAYVDAGADAILVHSRKADADEILEFAGRWREAVPLVIVPTSYYVTPVSAYRQAGIAAVIWANHNLRASIAAMRRVSARLANDESSVGIEPEIATLDELFALFGYDELSAAEERYLLKPP